jgi:hypothetical protein
MRELGRKGAEARWRGKPKGDSGDTPSQGGKGTSGKGSVERGDQARGVAVLRELVDNPKTPVAIRRLAAADLARVQDVDPVAELPAVEALRDMSVSELRRLLAR